MLRVPSRESRDSKEREREREREKEKKQLKWNLKIGRAQQTIFLFKIERM